MYLYPRGGDHVPTFNWVFEFLANIIENINTVKSLQKIRKQFANRRKRSPPLDPGSCLGYLSIIHLLDVEYYAAENARLTYFFMSKCVKYNYTVHMNIVSYVFVN